MNELLVPCLMLGAFLFCLGLYGALTRRKATVVLLSLLMMLNGAILNLVGFSRLGPTPSSSGQVFSLLAILVATATAVVGLSLLLALFRNKPTDDVQDMDELKD
ncbi:NADH-quinone oxidoreductase subunit NuoK [Gorillibacterium sp. CAU 1737]|uniref:NADH-quinone oxidoreductase subunit NuoK n=1 Tax=Gorillibacterium sp. CAU 1737 TaxID=3140362 RepID=UPI003260002E